MFFVNVNYRMHINNGNFSSFFQRISLPEIVTEEAHPYNEQRKHVEVNYFVNELYNTEGHSLQEWSKMQPIMEFRIFK